MIVPATRWMRLIFWLVFVLALVNWLYLYFFPDMAATNYAWSIKPGISAAALSVGYGAAVVISYYLLTLKDARQFQVILLPAALFSALEAIATALHADKFIWDYPPTWIWASIYAIIPFVLAGLYFYIERVAHQPGWTPPPAQPMTKSLRLVWLGGGLILLVVAFFMYVIPDVLIPLWPWKLTPLVSRAVGAWVALLALGSLMAGWYNDWYRISILLAASVAYFVLLLSLPFRFADSFDWGKPSAWLYIVAGLVGCALPIYSYFEKRRFSERITTQTQVGVGN